MAEFYITLPSNVPDHPENSSSSFITRLPEPIMLKTEKWKCGLAEIIYTNSFENVPEPLKFTAVDKNGNRTDYFLPAGNYRDALALVDSLSSITSNRRKRDAPAEENKPLTEEEQKKVYEEALRTGNVRPATAEEIEAKLAQIKRRKAAATALVVGSAIASDVAAYVPPPKPVQQQPAPQQPAVIQQQPAPVEQAPSQPAQQPSSQSNDSSKQTTDMLENIFNKFIKQSDSVNQKVLKSTKQMTDSLIDENKKMQALLQDSINISKDNTSTIVKEDKNNSANIVKAYQKQSNILVEENQKLQALLKETIAIQKANAADSKRIANSSNVRGFSLSRAQEQYTKYGFSFDFDPLLQRIVTYVNRNVLKYAELSPELAYLCGFSSQTDQEGFMLDEYKTIATYSIDFNNNLSAIFVYADCIQPSIVGNSKSQLLRIIPTSDQSSTISTVFNPIQHTFINKEFIETIRIRICDAFGKPIKFHFGTTICTLHFVKVKS